MNNPTNFTQIVVCPECFGKGRKRFDPCTVCGGSGRITDTQARAIEEANTSQDWKLTEAVLAIKIDDLSPIDALTKLYELRRLALSLKETPKI